MITSVLDELKQSNGEIVQLLEDLGELGVENLTPDKSIYSEFNEPSNTAIIAPFILAIKTLSLTLRNASEQVPSVLSLIHQVNLRKQPSQNKWKQPMTHLPLCTIDLMKFIIWNTRRANSVSFKCQYDALIRSHNPAMIALLESKMVDHKHLTETLYFDAYLESSAVKRK